MTSLGIPTLETWKRFEGLIVNDEFHLHQYLGGSEYGGVFLTQRTSQEKAAIKIIADDADYAELQLARWRMAEEIHHPHLLGVFGSGRCELDGVRLLYVLMEYADENLAHILPHRALRPVETRDMLHPLAQTLGFLHDQGIVHGHVKPSNIMAVTDQLKFSSDGLSTEPDSGERAKRFSPYEAPEAQAGRLTPAADVWSVGMTLVEVLTQRLPVRGGAELIAANLPEPFNDIARNCLRSDPAQRWSIPGILARLEGPPVAPPIEIVSRFEEKAAVAETSAPPRKHNLLMRYVLAVAVALIVIAIAALTNPGRRPAPAGVADSQASVASDSSKAASAASQPMAPRSETGSIAGAPPSSNPAAAPRATGTLKGVVLHQEFPSVLPSARETVEGHLKVAVRVSVNENGDVVSAKFDSPGPSKYFARISMEAAQHWKFKAPQADGQNVASEWVLRFEFTNSATRVDPSQVAPRT